MFVGLHIHKTAGTSLLRYLEKYAPQRLYGAYSLRNYRQCEMPLWACGAPLSKDIYWGHSIYESFFYDSVRPLQLFTFLRDPSDRIISWYSMLKRRKKLKNSGDSLQSFAEAHSNSICRMLVDRFPSLSGSPSDTLAERAFSVLESMCFVGFQCNYTEHIKILLEWLDIPVKVNKLDKKHNTAKKKPDISQHDMTMLNNLNDQDNILYRRAYDKFSHSPLSPQNKLAPNALVIQSSNNLEDIRQQQLLAAQKKFLLSLRASVGEVGVEHYISQIRHSFESCDDVYQKIIHSNKNHAHIIPSATSN